MEPDTLSFEVCAIVREMRCGMCFKMLQGKGRLEAAGKVRMKQDEEKGRC